MSTCANGGKSGELRYHPYGTTRYTWGTTPTDRRFTGQIADAAIGLYYYNARYYDPALGRFVQADTVVPSPGNPQALNRYAYAVNNPVRYTDPSGHWYYDEGVDALVHTRGDDRQLRDYLKTLQPPTRDYRERPGKPVSQQRHQNAKAVRVINAALGIPEIYISSSGSLIQLGLFVGGSVAEPTLVGDALGAGAAIEAYHAIHDPPENILGWVGFGLTALADYFDGYTYYDRAASEFVIGQNTTEDFIFAAVGQGTSLIPIGAIDMVTNVYCFIDDWADIQGKPTWELRVSLTEGPARMFGPFEIRTESYPQKSKTE